MSRVEPLVLPVVDEVAEAPAWIREAAQSHVAPFAIYPGDPNPEDAGVEAQDAAETERGERPVSRLPPPPNLGSLVPGGRSNPPPANDFESEGLRERAEVFAQAAIELAIARAAALAQLERQVLDLCIEVAAAIIEQQVEFDPELHGVFARAALRTLGDASRATLRTSPEAYAAVTQSLGGSAVNVRGVRVEIVADGSLPGLGCIVDAEHIRVDATVAERLRAVRVAFEEQRRRGAGGHE